MVEISAPLSALTRRRGVAGGVTWVMASGVRVRSDGLYRASRPHAHPCPAARRASAPVGRQHEDLARIDAVRITDLLLVGLVDDREAHALAVDALADPPQAVAARHLG